MVSVAALTDGLAHNENYESYENIKDLNYSGMLVSVITNLRIVTAPSSSLLPLPCGNLIPDVMNSTKILTSLTGSSTILVSWTNLSSPQSRY